MAEPAVTGATAPIVVAINAARRCGETLELAAALAAGSGADLEVVFVEDANLLRLADLPVTHEVDRISGMARALDSRTILRALHCEVQQLRRELARLGKSMPVRSTVRVVRGHYLTEALAASAGVDVTFVHGARRALPGEPLPSMWGRPMGTAAAHRGSRRAGARRPLWTLFDGSAASTRALKVAMMLARTLTSALVVLVPGRGADEIEVRMHEARMATGGTDLQFLVVAKNWLSQPAPAVPAGAGGLLVLARKEPEAEDSAARSFLESLSVPVVLVT